MKRARESSAPLHRRVEGLPLFLQSPYAAAATDDGMTLRASDHTYMDAKHPGRYYMPVSTLQARFFAPFDETAMAQRVAGKWTRARGDLYMSMSVADVLALWQCNRNEASRLGTEMHARFERYYDGGLQTLSDGDVGVAIEMDHFEAFQRNHPYLEPLAVERIFVDRELQLAGTADIIFRDLRDPDPRAVVIADWKRARELRTTSFGGQCGVLAPTRALPDCNYERYRINMGLYKYMAEKHTDVRVTEMILVGCHPEHMEYERVDVAWSRDYMNEIIAERLRDKLVRPGGLAACPLRRRSSVY